MNTLHTMIFAGKNQKSSRSTFTLIELLVVIAIIAILASMLMPALQQARERARSSSCSSQLKQVSSAMQFYTEDFKGYVFVNDSTLTNAPHWGMILVGMASWSKGKYIDPKVLLCPAIKNIEIPPGSWAPFGASVNSNLYGMWNPIYEAERRGGRERNIGKIAGDFIGKGGVLRGYFKPGILKKPSGTLQFADVGKLVFGATDFGRSYTFFTTVKDDIYGKPRGIWRLHSDKANVAFIDGHVASLGGGELFATPMCVNRSYTKDGLLEIRE